MPKRVRVWVDFEDAEDGSPVWVSMGGYELFRDGQPVTNLVRSYVHSLDLLPVDYVDELLAEGLDWTGVQETFPL